MNDTDNRPAPTAGEEDSRPAAFPGTPESRRAFMLKMYFTSAAVLVMLSLAIWLMMMLA